MTRTGLQQKRQIVATDGPTISLYETLSLLEGVRFFAPTIELTEELVLRVEQERNKQLEKIRQDPTQVEEISDEKTAPSSTLETLSVLVSSGLAEIKKLSSGYLGQARHNSNTQAWQRMIAEEFYHHLTFLVDSPLVEANEPFFMQRVVASSMGNLLGLSREDELLTKLAEQFAEWLKAEGGEFTAGWGRIILADQSRFYLEKFLPAEDEETISPAGFAITIHGRSAPTLTSSEGES
jgi:hypothetical protein